MYQKNKISTMLIVIAILQILLPVLSVVFESGITSMSEAVESGNWEYTINEDGNTITITEYNGTDADVVIPSNIDGYTVSILGNGSLVSAEHGSFSVFYYSSYIKTIKLPNTIKRINSIAFYGCKNLTSIELNEGLEIIENQAFYGCEKLEKIIIPSTVNSIICNNELSPFYGCDELISITVHSDNQYYSSVDGVLFNNNKTILMSYPSSKKDESYTVPESVEHIYGQAFNNSYIKYISISQYTSAMEGNKFTDKYDNTSAILGCTNLQSITVDELNENYSSEDGILYNKDKSILLVYPSGKEENYYSIPNTVSSCKTINNSYIETIKLNSLINSAEFLMSITNLKNIEVNSENTNYIQKDGVLFNKNGDEIIYYPQGREEPTYTIDENVVRIQSKAFMNSKIAEIDLPDSIVEIGSYAFYNCENLSKITIPNSVESIGDHAFYKCSNLANVTIPNNIELIGDYTFYKCSNLEKIVIPSSVKRIGEYAFYNCVSLKELIFEENSKIEEIGMDAFYNCDSLQEVNIPEGITNIGTGFDDCDNLKIINIPSTVENIKIYSFYGSYTSPQVITIYNDNPTISQRLGIFKSGLWSYSDKML